ncbi:MAG: HIT domain-containing protein [Candidatus Riflebacteria bacterium]|nr:HIT domain-containing protein [Candidatus Riflebacteria bacterium]
MVYDKQLFIPNKRDYIKGDKRPDVECIICSILDEDPEVTNLLIWKNDQLGISVNLYPYNAGHVMIFPTRHVTDVRELTEEEMLNIERLTAKTMDILDKQYQPAGYNIGYNIGYASGASVKHLHKHIVPRYIRELGFMDVIGGSKIIIEDPKVTVKNLTEAFKNVKLP